MKIVAIGDRDPLRGFMLAGVEVLAAHDAAAVSEAWDGLGDDVGLVLLTPSARAGLTGRLGGSDRLWLELPS